MKTKTPRIIAAVLIGALAPCRTVLLAFAAAIALAGAVPAVHAANKPNILLIIADDMSYSDLGCFTLATNENS